MKFAQERRKATVLAVLGGLAVAALLVGGCATPSRDERAQFTTLSGFVRTASGNPVAGATITVVRPGTANYYGPETFVTDPNGRFVIDGVQVRNVSPVTLRLRASAPGYGPAYVTRAGAARPDIEVTPANLPLTDLHAILNPGAAVAVITPAGGTVTAPVYNPVVPAAALGTVRVEIPAGALTTSEQITVTPVVASALPAPLPGAAAGTTAAPVVFPAVPVTTTAVTRTVTLLLVAVDLQPDGLTFPTGREPTIYLPLPVALPLGSLVPIMRYNPNNGLWEFETNATVVNVGGQLYAQFKVSRFSVRGVGVTAEVTLGASGPVVASETFPPTPQFPNGYVPVAPVLTNTLEFLGVTDLEVLSVLMDAYAGVRPGDTPVQGVVVPGFVPPPAQGIGIRCDKRTFPVTVNIPGLNLSNIQGTRSSWTCNRVTVQPVETLPAHIQGHFQGGQ